MASRSFFLVIEGLDGSGKDAVLSRLLGRFSDETAGNELFLSKHQNVARTREPTASSESGRWLAEKLKDGTLGAEPPALVAQHYVSDRKIHGREIRWLLGRGYVVLSSRYDLSTFAYQGAQGVPLHDLYGIHGFARGECPVPDLTLFIDVDAATAMARIERRGGGKEYFEKREFLEKVRGSYLAAIAFLRERDRRAIAVIDASGSLDEVCALAARAVAAKIGA
ncbi:MAG: dTMP kinase [Spirochaetes bacterium]|nr:dTMP kinase [Spirochaetota bacterium]